MAKLGDIAKGDGWELRCGPYDEVFIVRRDRVDCIITDPPYSERVHVGHDAMANNLRQDGLRNAIKYASWNGPDVGKFMRWANRMARGWVCTMSDHELARWYSEHAMVLNRYAFAPLPCVIPGMTVRMAGDGPSSWHVSLNVSRPRCEPWSKWGTLPGAYHSKREKVHIVGGKPLHLMRAIVRDYSRRGDLVCDPCAGGGTTLLAAVTEGRRAIGSEADPETFEKAVARMRRGRTETFDFGE